MNFSEIIINWYQKNKRNLPWRNTKNPYFIWLSEVILQQTRVAQGEPYYHKFIQTFPTLKKMAQAHEDEVLKIWQGLGYYSRARNLLKTAQYVTDHLNGEFPVSYNELIKLKGIGDYTASAIASFAANEDVAVLDGNVYRVLARYFDIDLNIADLKNKKYFKDILKEILPIGNSANFNQAIMEFGALQCVPKNPKCDICPLHSSCMALKNNLVKERPVKIKKLTTKNRFLNYIYIKDVEEYIYIEKRVQKDIWENLYQFKLIETKSELQEENVLQFFEKEFEIDFDKNSFRSLNHLNVKHKLTHQNLYISFYEVKTLKRNDHFIKKEDIDQYAFPIVLFNFLQKIV